MTTTMAEIDAAFDEVDRRTREAIIHQLHAVGLQAVNHARSLPSPSAADFKGKKIPPHTPNYMDWTDNLRSSIGYIISDCGTVVGGSDFATIRNGSQGSADGMAYARSLAGLYPNDIALILVAGEHYASYVADDHYDVIDTASLLAERLAQQLLADIKL